MEFKIKCTDDVTYKELCGELPKWLKTKPRNCMTKNHQMKMYEEPSIHI